MKHKLDSFFWNSKYKNLETGWDLGSPTPFFTKYIKSIDKTKLICFPGAGYGYDPIFYANRGYNVYAIEYAQIPVLHMKKKNIKNLHVLNIDFFNMSENYNNYFDIIIEYTFYCAINPDFREIYFKQMYKILRSGGEIVGLYLPINTDDTNGPPFKISLEEIQKLIKNKFVIKEQYYVDESVESRKGNEIFIRMQKIGN